ncbi:hypothetical protein LBMAG53_07230 [Planctomycetota bacterium]|nr:hypothetical protein LBMAG53_07230 [Planctomycetota bacterium]
MALAALPQTFPAMRLVPFLLVPALMLSGCISSTGRSTDPGRGLGATAEEQQKNEAETRADIAILSAGKTPDDPDASAACDQARERLIARGSTIESLVWEALISSPDWGVRLGCVEVLQAIGTRASVEKLMAVLDDPEPLVAFHADVTLRVMFDHREIPTAGQPIGSNQLPPVPVRPATDNDPEADRKLWAAWHAQYAKLLRAAWEDWWKTAKSRAILDPSITRKSAR